MAVSAAYLTKVRRAVRRNQSTDVDAELTDIIEECRLDLQAPLASPPLKATDGNGQSHFRGCPFVRSLEVRSGKRGRGTQPRRLHAPKRRVAETVWLHQRGGVMRCFPTR